MWSLRARSLTSTSHPFFFQRRFKTKKPILPKIKIKYQITDDQQVILPEKIPLYTKNQMERFQKYMAKKIRQRDEGVDFSKYISETVREWVESKYGQEHADRRAIGRRNRNINRKYREFTKAERRNRFWQEKQDAKEYRILRDQMRDERIAKREPFVLKRFLRVYQEWNMKPFVIHDFETFCRKLHEDQMKSFYKGPLSVSAKKTGDENYDTRFKYEIWDPFWYELRRKIRFTSLIKKREADIAAQKELNDLHITRIQKAIRKRQKFDERLAKWMKVAGAWFAENDKLRSLKNKYRLAQQEVMVSARREFLVALNEESSFWIETPDECKFMRFYFGKGVTFPYNRTPYS
eukprot:TRINITY_DN3750_c0_g1_i1.p1 TRINITY_DN3750_c0_g1~~TRINITY_DN3750_c0_g1_i1.p1  ORF type:complete len:349 (+),score=48.05 TRINITY_DN3750_c0_g1_i1:56-1102(+)